MQTDMKKKRFITEFILACFAWFFVVIALLVVARAYSRETLYADEAYLAKHSGDGTEVATSSGKAAGTEDDVDPDSGVSGENTVKKTAKNEEPKAQDTAADGQSDTGVAVSENGAEDIETVPAVSYRIEGDNVPAPDPDKFVKLSLADADKMKDVIAEARASGLLGEDEKVIFSPDVEFVSWGDIRYYLDDSIFVVVWKEMKNGRYMTYGEIKVRDASQFRRKLADDTYGSPTQYFCTQLDEQVNSVVTMNADFYAFRNLGITVYDGEVHRFETSLDVLFIDENGDFIYYDRNTDTTKEDIEKFVKDNGVQFSLAFGPVMVRDHKLVDISSYPIGQNEARYSRTCFCQVDRLHYLFANIGYFSKENTGGTSEELSQWVWEKGVKEAYMMDGGQTSEIIFNGEIFNLLSYGNERTVSDMIYFATAVEPEG